MIRVSYRRDGDRWVGILRDGNEVIAECGHTHRNRDVSTQTNGEAAQVCARMILAGARNPATAEHRAERYRTAWLAFTRGGGFTVPASVIQDAKKEGAARAAAYLALVDQVRALLTDRQPTPTPSPTASATADLGDMPDWMF